ncbi:MAG: hypothetical protein AAFY57_19855 [Cyanobacteria bacterium J06642_2]
MIPTILHFGKIRTFDPELEYWLLQMVLLGLAIALTLSTFALPAI